MGNSLNCASGQSSAADHRRNSPRKNQKEKWQSKKRKKLLEAVEGRRHEVETIRGAAQQLLPDLSQHDRQLVEEQLRTTDRKCRELQTEAEKKQRSYGSLGGDLGHIRAEAEQYLQWLEQTSQDLSSQSPPGLQPDQAQQLLTHTQELSEVLEEKQATLESVRQQAEALFEDLTGPERQSLDTIVRCVMAQHTQCVELVTQQQQRLEASERLRRDFWEAVSKQQEWLANLAKATDKLDTVRLLASEVDRQIEESKSLAVRLQGRDSHVEELKALGERLKANTTVEGSQRVEQELQELGQQQQAITERLKQQEEHLLTCADTRRQFETNVKKLEHWCRETDVICGIDIPLDCSLEVLQEQIEKYQVMAITAELFSAMLNETMAKGEAITAELSKDDCTVLEQQLAELQHRLHRTSALVTEQLQSLDSTFKERQQLHSSLENCKTWLDNMQEQIKSADCLVGPTVEQAKASLDQYECLEKQLGDYQSVIGELNSRVECLRAEGQIVQAQDILSLTSQFELLIDHLTSCRNKRQTSLAARQQYERLLAEVTTGLDEGRKALQQMQESGGSMEECLLKYKELQDRLSSLPADISAAESQAAQILVDCLDQEEVMLQVEGARGQLSELCSVLSACQEQCQQVLQARKSFEAAMMNTMAWLEDKEDVLASLQPLHLDSDRVDTVMDRHRVVSREALERLDRMKEKADLELSHFQQLGEPIAQNFRPKVQQMEDLRNSIQEAIEKKEQYLQEAKADRKQLETSMQQVSDWLHGAEELLDSGVDGLDYSTMDNTLSEFTDYFSEASLCQDEVEQVTELSAKLLDTLDANDTQTLQQSLTNVGKRLSRVLAASEKQQQLLETKVAQWHSYQAGLQEHGQVMEQLQEEWHQISKTTLVSPQQLDDQLNQIKIYVCKLEEGRVNIGSLNETARALLRTANPASAVTINQQILSLNQHWDDLVSQAEERLTHMDDMKSQWLEFNNSLHGAEDVISFAQETMATVSLPGATKTELVEQLDTVTSINDELEGLTPQIERLKQCSTDIQKALPSAEAKVMLQDSFISFLENYERLQAAVSERLSLLQEEMDDRDIFQVEASQTLSWLTDTQQALLAMDPAADDVAENIEKCQTYQLEISVRTEQIKRLTLLQETKYSALGHDMPQEMQQQLIDMHSLEKQVSAAVREKEEELMHLGEDRVEFEALLESVKGWLQQAEQELKQRSSSMAQALQHHQGLLCQFDDVKQQLDRLRRKGGDIIRHSGDQAEKQEVQKTLASVNRQWLSLQAATAERTHELSEAAELQHAVQEVAQSVEQWLHQAQRVVGLPIDWAYLASIRDQLQSHQRLCRELGQNEDKLLALNAMVKQLDQVCDTKPDMAALASLRQRVQHVGAEGQSRLGQLDEARRKMEDYEKEMAELRRWMEETRTHISMRDTTRDLKEQLAVQEVGPPRSSLSPHSTSENFVLLCRLLFLSYDVSLSLSYALSRCFIDCYSL